MIAPSGEQVEIAFGDQRAVVVEVGGGLRAYSSAAATLLDGYGPTRCAASGRGQVLIPWPNRLQDGSYEFDGRSHQLPLTEPEHAQRDPRPRPLGRLDASPSASRDRVVMEHLLHPQPGYPFTLALGIEYALSDAGLAGPTTARRTSVRRAARTGRARIRT